MSFAAQMVAGGLLGIGAVYMLWRWIKQRDDFKAKADTEASYIGGKIIAEAAQDAAKKASDDAKADPGSNPLDW